MRSVLINFGNINAFFIIQKVFSAVEAGYMAC
jgi:hypothetical protein